MSYLHCPTCKCAYNFALSTQCPNCPVPASAVDATEDIIAAAEQLARAMARATPSERKAATARMDQLALPAPGAKPVTFHGGMLRSIREALEPVAPPPVPKPQPLRNLPQWVSSIVARSAAAPQARATRSGADAREPLLAAIAYAVVERISERINEHAPQLMDRIPSRLRRAGSLVRARVRALAA
jgi:hypothetical protein